MDNCPFIHNPGQTDSDRDGMGDPCDVCPLDPDNDLDRDRICGDVDICPRDSFNDIDHDGICGDVDACPRDPHNDVDADGLCGDADLCPRDSDPGQADGDRDGIGDACDRFGAATTVTGVLDAPFGVAAADLDGDGDLDVAACGGNVTEEGAVVAWYENAAADGSSWIAHLLSDTQFISRTIGVADVEGDGDIDVLYASADHVAWFENRGAAGPAWPIHVIDNVSEDPRAVVAADFDADGDMDVASAARGDDLVAWHENLAGDGLTWTRHVISAAHEEANSLAVADADGDGDPDLFAGGGAAIFARENRLSLYVNAAGDGSVWTETTLRINPSHAFASVGAADVDRDGDVDLFASTLFGPGNVPGRVSWYANVAGDGRIWTERTIHSEFLNYESVFPADVDGDGDTDVLTSTGYPHGASWHENLAGDGSSWKIRHITRSNSSSPEEIVAGDVDGDGDPDAVAAIRYGDSVVWHENTGGPNRPPLADAGPDLKATCTGPEGAVVTLDAGGSSDPDGDPLAYAWSGPFDAFATDDPVAPVRIPPGVHVVRLEVRDPGGLIASDTLSIVVAGDREPTLVVTPDTMWPPDHRMVRVRAEALGLCGEPVILRSVVSSEPDDAPGGGDGHTVGDVQDAAIGEADAEFLVRAERSRQGDGRIYTVTCEVRRGGGTSVETLEARVRVPLDARRSGRRRLPAD